MIVGDELVKALRERQKVLTDAVMTGSLDFVAYKAHVAQYHEIETTLSTLDKLQQEKEESLDD